MDEKANFIRKFWQKRNEVIEDPRIATHFKDDDAIHYDFNLVKQFCHKNKSLLDLGAGACTLANMLSESVREIMAVDFSESLMKKVKSPSNVYKVIADLRNFYVKTTFDIILLFGVMNYFFCEKEIFSLYDNIKKMMNKNSMLIVKHQMGIRETVVIDNYSEEIKDHYIAIYRQRDEEVNLLKKIFKVTQIIDIYPPSLNKWENTHFYALICTK